MKNVYLTSLFLIFFSTTFSQVDWKTIQPPADIQSFATVNKYQVDSDGNVYAIYYYYDGTNFKIVVDKYVPLNQAWARIYSQNLANSISEIKVDKQGTAIYFTFVAQQFPTPIFKLYKLEFGVVSLKLMDFVPDYDAISTFDFKVGNQPDEYFWFFQNSNASDYTLGAWDAGALDIVSYNVPQFNSLSLTGLQLQAVGDTLWMSAGQSTTDTRLVKTHKTNVSFFTFDNSAQGIFLSGGGSNLFAEYTLLMSNRIDKLTLHSLDASNGIHEFTGINSVFTAASVTGDFFKFPTGIASDYASNKVFAFTNFALDPSGTTHELKLLEKDYGTDTWTIVGPAANQIFKVNDNYANRATMGYSEAAMRAVVGYDSAAAIVPSIRVLNTIPDISTLNAVFENTLCPGTAINLFTELSITDENLDPLKIVGVSSTDASIINPTDVTASTGALIGNRQYFNVSIANSVAGTCDLTFNVSDGFDTIQVTQTVTIAAFTISSTSGAGVCGSGTDTLAASLPGTGVINWYSVSSGGTADTTGFYYAPATVFVPTTFYAEGYDNNCYTARVPVLLDVFTLPTVDAGLDQSVCDGVSVTLSGAGAASYSWDNGVSDGIAFTSASAGFTTYTVTGTDANGCTNTDQVDVTVNALPTVDAGTDQFICPGTSTTLNGSGATSYVWDNGVSDGVSFTPVANLTYTVTGTDGNGCVNTDLVDVSLHTLPTVDAGLDQTVCENDIVTLNGSGAGIYLWDNGATDGVPFAATATQTYTTTGTDANGCSNTDAVTITVNSAPAVNAGSDQTICSGDIATLSGSGAVSYTWDNGVTDAVAFSPTATITYTVTGTDGLGCTNTDQADVIVVALPTVNAGANQTVCAGDVITLSGSGASSYSWDNGVTDGVAFAATTSKIYTVTGTSGACTNTDQVFVIVNALPTINAGSDVNLCTGASHTLSGSGASTYSWDNGVTDGVSFTPGSSLTYTVTGTDANGCINTDQIDINVNSLPIVDAGTDQSICIGDNVTLSGSGASTYSWDNGATDGVAFALGTTTTFTVTGTDAGGCVNTDVVTVTVNALPTVDAGLDQTICIGASSVTLGGSGASSYVWDNGVADGVPFNPVSTLTYTVTGTDVNGCINTDQVDVTVNTLPAVDAGVDQSVCSGGTITLSGSGASSYSWDNGVTNGVVFSPSTLTYTLTGTDANGCISTDQVDITVNALPSVSAGADQNSCSGSSITLAGTGANSYSWDNGVTDAVSFTPASTLTYTVTGTDLNGCVNTDQAVVTVNAAPTVSAGADQSICIGDVVTLSGSGAVSYTWDFGVSDGSPFSPTTTKTYTVTGTDAGGCQATDQVDIVVNSLPSVNAGANQTVCNGSSITLNGSGASSYAWDNSVTDGVAFAVTSSTVYTVTGTDANGCINTDQVFVIVNLLPTVNAGADQNICAGDGLILSGSGTTSYSWDNGVTDGVFFNPAGTLTYTVTGTDGNGCQNTDQVIVSVNALPTVGAGLDQTVCDGANVTLNGSGATSYTWDNGVTNAVVFNPSSTLTYTVTGTDANGCVNTDQVDINVNGLPIVDAGLDQTICLGASVTLSGSGAVSFTWDNSVTDGVSFAPASSLTYTVTGTDVNGCTATDQVDVNVNSLPVVDAGTDQTICVGASVTLFGAGASSFTWDNAVTDGISFTPGSTLTYTVTGTDLNGCIGSDQVDVIVNTLPVVNAGPDQTVCDGTTVILAGTGAVSYSWDNFVSDSIPFVVNSTLTYTLTGTDANGCINTDQVDINVKGLPTVDAGLDQTICLGASLTLSGSGAVSFTWDNSVTDGVSFAPASSLTYTVTGTDVNGCTATDQVDVNVNSLPVVDAGTDQTICVGASVTLFGAGASSFTWDNGITDGISFTPGSTLTYTVTGTDFNGCISTDQVDIIVNTLPVVNAGPDQTVCDGTTVILAGTGAVSYSWDNFVSDSIPFVVNSTLTYTLTGTDANGCINTDQVDINVNGLPVVGAGLDQTICMGASVTLSGSGAVSFTWDNSVTDGVSFTPASSLTYTVTGTDVNGCTATDQVDVNVNSLPVVDAGTDQTICVGASVTLFGVGASSFTWDNAVTDGISFTPGSTLTYTVTGTDLNGCINTDQVDIIVNTLPVVDAGFDQSICAGATVTLAGSGASSYNWDNGITDSVAFTPISSLTYTVTGTDINGCQNTDLVDVNVIALPVVTTSPTLELCELEQLTLTATSSAPILLWYDVPSGGVEIASGSSYETPILSASTTYYVEAFENGCSSTRIPISVNINGKPVIAISSTDSDCGNTNGTATASISSGTAPFTHYWSSGEQQVFAITGLTTGSYYFSVEDGKGCKAIAVTEVKPTSITINPILINPTCFQYADGSIDLNVTGFSGQLTYLWNTGQNTATATGLKGGTYEVSITNDAGCLVTESFVLVEPSLIENTISTILPECGDNDGNITVSSTTGGSAPYFYSWSNGKTGSNNNNVTYGAYTLNTTDNAGCTVQDILYLSEKNAPLIEGAITPTQCKLSTGAIDLDITPFPGDAVQSISWSNGQTSQNLNNLAAGNYVSFISTVNNCIAVNGWKVETGKPTTQEICLVSVDSVTTTNLVVWEKIQTTGISHYNIYRESNQIDDYQLIDTVDFNSLSVFNDVIASPTVRSWRYKISSVDECGTESLLSAHHKTLHLNTFDLGASGVKITWDKYEGTTFTNYILWRYTDLNGWENIATLPTGVLNFTDATLFSEPGLDYMVEITLSQICTATVWRAQDFNTSRSNKEKGIFNPGNGAGNFSNNSLVEFENGAISLIVYPNPFENTLLLEMNGTDNLDVSIFDIHGKLIHSQKCYQGQSTLDLTNISDGVYFVKANVNKQEQTIKIIKQ